MMHGQTNEATAHLLARVLPDPANPDGSPRAFADWEKGLEHLMDHALTAPECFGWILVIPECRTIVEPNEQRARTRYAQRARETRITGAQDLDDAYCGAVIRDTEDTVRLGWSASKGAAAVILGTCGVLVLTECRGPACRGVKTAFMPGWASRKAGVGSRSEELAPFGFPRTAGRQRARPRRHGAGSAREQRAHQRRRAGWTEEWQLDSDGLRRAVGFIRTRYYGQDNPFGQRHHCHDALLAGVLPRRSGGTFRQGRTYRQMCGRGGQQP